jgi:predicted amidohydrolase
MLDVAIVQTKPHKAQFARNLEQLQKDFVGLAGSDGPDLIVLPEAALTGYFLEGGVYDLALSAEAFAAKLNAAWQAAGATRTVDIACGFFENDGGTYYNSALYATLEPNGAPTIVHVHRKMFLATYGVFDEERFLTRGRALHAFATAFGTVATIICEDAWHSIVPTIAALKGARVLIVHSASPGRGLCGDGELESVTYWHRVLIAAAAEHGVYIVYAGLTGFEGGKGMAGSSCIVSPRGDVIASADEFSSGVVIRAHLDAAEIELARATSPLLGDLMAVLPDLLYDDALPLPGRGSDGR